MDKQQTPLVTDNTDKTTPPPRRTTQQTPPLPLVRINAVVYYSTFVFRSAGIASDVAASALIGASNVFGTIVASSLMDSQGRKTLLITSFSGMADGKILLSLNGKLIGMAFRVLTVIDLTTKTKIYKEIKTYASDKEKALHEAHAYERTYQYQVQTQRIKLAIIRLMHERLIPLICQK
ncbi:hypothetical protein Fmac_031979 [Flemingia macrophylla]|uniref:Uncharacterized protein n=1 Tax=Flemingia macrophylla TaxID=520843 RepID=A0ABD1L3J5_9FABA